MACAPVTNRGDDGNERLALARQAILDPGRNDAKILAVDQSLFGQRLQLSAEHARGDLGAAVGAAQQAGPDFAVTQRTILQVPDDPQLVLSADHFLECRDRATASRCRRRFGHLPLRWVARPSGYEREAKSLYYHF